MHNIKFPAKIPSRWFYKFRGIYDALAGMIHTAFGVDLVGVVVFCFVGRLVGVIGSTEVSFKSPWGGMRMLLRPKPSGKFECAPMAQQKR